MMDELGYIHNISTTKSLQLLNAASITDNSGKSFHHKILLPIESIGQLTKSFVLYTIHKDFFLTWKTRDATIFTM